MRSAAGFIGLAFTLALAGGAEAADWALAAASGDGVTYETDLGSIVASDRVVKSWMRETLPAPQADPETGKDYLVTVRQRFDDCGGRRFRLGQFVRRGAGGEVVAEGRGDPRDAWQEIVPDSIAEGVSRTVCAVARPPGEPPILDDPEEGAWTELGPSADGKYRLQLRKSFGGVRDDGAVIAISRSVYGKPEWIDGLAIRMIVSETAVDCARRESAGLGADYYLSPQVRVKAVRVPEEDVAFQRAAPGSYLAASIKALCGKSGPTEPRSARKARGKR